MDRKERLRARLENDEFLEEEFEQQQIVAEPSRAKQFGRKMMDKLGIYSEKSERMRDREMMGVVLAEYREEKARRRLEALKREEELIRARQEREREEAEHQQALERKALEGDMSKARSYFESHKQEKFEGQRVQESLEKELNSRLTTVDGLEEAVLAEEEGVSRRTVEFEGSEIPVYDLTGKPFEMVSHAVDYRYANWSMGNADIGNKTAQDLLVHPEVWERTREEVETEEGYGTRREDAKGDVISCSYVNSEKNIDSRVAKFGGYYTLCYGFERMPADSLLYATGGDGGTSNTGGKGEAALSRSDMGAIERFEGAGGTPMYNEMVLRRYDESGEPLKPSYIIAENGQITEAAMRHAKHFGIPIVNIERKNYDTRLAERAREAIDKVGPESSYDEISEAITVLRRAPAYYHKFHAIEGTGRAFDIKGHEQEKKMAAPGSMEEKIWQLEELEFEKRIDLIEEALRAGDAPGGAKPEGFEFFTAFEEKGNGMPMSCDSVLVQFRRKGDPRFVKTTAYDGEGMTRVDEAVQMGYMTEEDASKRDSGVYQRLAPIVREYRKR